MRIKRNLLPLRSKNQNKSTIKNQPAHKPAKPHKVHKHHRRHTPERRNITRPLIQRIRQNLQTRRPARAPHTQATDRPTHPLTAGNTAKNPPANLLWVIKKLRSRDTKPQTRVTNPPTRFPHPIHLTQRTPRAAKPHNNPSNQRKNSSVSLEAVTKRRILPSTAARHHSRPSTPRPRHLRQTVFNPAPNTAANSASFLSAASTKSAKTA